MRSLLKRGLAIALFSLPLITFAQDKIVNLYAWTGEIPEQVIRQFEKETGIKVNLSTYENNEVMYTKLRATKNAGYDVVMPSGYFVDRMRKQKMLEKLDKNLLSNWKNLNPRFIKLAYDPTSEYSVPFVWGVTGLFLNDHYFAQGSIKKWSDLWNARYKNQLLLLDDIREVFSMALLALGYSANDTDPQHIKAAYLKLKELMSNVKLFASDTVISIVIDEDAQVGMAWNGDAFKAVQENPHIQFVFPQEGFLIWVDNFVIPQNAPHQETAYRFINFMLRSDIAKTVAMETLYSTTNLTAQQQLPPKIKNNPTIYPSNEILRRGEFQKDVGEETLALFEKYWEALKMGG